MQNTPCMLAGAGVSKPDGLCWL